MGTTQAGGHLLRPGQFRILNLEEEMCLVTITVKMRAF